MYPEYLENTLIRHDIYYVNYFTWGNKRNQEDGSCPHTKTTSVLGSMSRFGPVQAGTQKRRHIFILLLYYCSITTLIIEQNRGTVAKHKLRIVRVEGHRPRKGDGMLSYWKQRVTTINTQGTELKTNGETRTRESSEKFIKFCTFEVGRCFQNPGESINRKWKNTPSYYWSC